MAQHKVRFTVPVRRQVLSGDIVFEVWADGDKLGRLKISQGGLDWLPRYRKQPISYMWEEFDVFMRRDS